MCERSSMLCHYGKRVIPTSLAVVMVPFDHYFVFAQLDHCLCLCLVALATLLRSICRLWCWRPVGNSSHFSCDM